MEQILTNYSQLKPIHYEEAKVDVLRRDSNDSILIIIAIETLVKSTAALTQNYDLKHCCETKLRWYRST